MAAPARQRSYSVSASPQRNFALQDRPPEHLRAANGSSGSSTSRAEHVQVLFAHTDSKIVNFTFNATTILRGEPLPWSSPVERTIASGPLRIYKTVPHDVAFIQSGPALKPLLSKTQCWNVDGGQTFCLQLRPGNYWRIEILGVDVERDNKCTEFRNVLAKIVAFEVTACPFSRSGNCPPVVEIPQALQPAKVWRRPSMRPIENAKNARPQTSSGIELKRASKVKDISLQSAGGIFGIKTSEPVEIADKVERKLDHPISLGNPEGPLSDPRRASLSGPRKEPSFETFEQRRAKYGSVVRGRRTSIAEGCTKPLTRHWALENAPRRGSAGGELFTGRWCQETATDTADATEGFLAFGEVEKPTPIEETHDPVKDVSFLEDYGLDLKNDRSEQSERCQTPSPPRFRTAIFSPEDSPLTRKPTRIIANDDNVAPLSSSPGSEPWHDFTPQQSPLRGKEQILGVSPTLAAPPVVNSAATLGVSHYLSRPSTPEIALWYTPAQQPPCGWPSPGPREGPMQATMELSAVVCVDSPRVSPVPTLSSPSESESDFAHLDTPTRVRPATAAPVLDAHTPQRQVRRVTSTSSLVLAKTANIAAATANFVVLKPSAFLVALMFSIATRVATRAVAGAAYSLAERGDLAGVWDDDGDDLETAVRGERRRRRSEVLERQAWGLEDRVRRKNRK